MPHVLKVRFLKVELAKNCCAESLSNETLNNQVMLGNNIIMHVKIAPHFILCRLPCLA